MRRLPRPRATELGVLRRNFQRSRAGSDRRSARCDNTGIHKYFFLSAESYVRDNKPKAGGADG